MSEIYNPVIKEPTINFAIGPSCLVRCEGCYNHFGNTAIQGGLVTAEQVISFASDAAVEGITQTTISGGDPLFHPEIVTILGGLKDLGMKIKLDTVGTPLLGETRIAYKGKGTVPKVDIEDISPHVDYVNLPLDGANQDTIANFRRGRNDLFNETRQIAAILRGAGVVFGFNTVANATNITALNQIRDIAEEEKATEWQIFEYDDEGPNPSSKKGGLRLEPGQFDAATTHLESTSGKLSIFSKNLDSRSGIYFLVDDSGLAWKPAGEGFRHILGHITNDREQALSALRKHIASLKSQ
jgi:MoaA/NifB/PqqE/SkfB family radical SAM enzyme